MSKADLLRKGGNDYVSKHSQVFNDVKNINISEIKTNPFQPRKSFNEETIKELAQSIKSSGLLQPISITSKNVLIAGERRLKACKFLGWLKIKAIVVSVKDDKELEELAILENLQREDLSLFDEARAIGKLVCKSSIRNVAEALGKNKGYIDNRNTIGKLSDRDANYCIDNGLKIKEMLEVARIGLQSFLGRRQKNEDIPTVIGNDKIKKNEDIPTVILNDKIKKNEDIPTVIGNDKIKKGTITIRKTISYDYDFDKKVIIFKIPLNYKVNAEELLAMSKLGEV